MAAAAAAGFLPSLAAFFPPTPEAYAFQLRIFQYFPLVTISQWFSSYHPAGKTSLPRDRFNIPGRVAWCLMELVGPVQLVYILARLPQQQPNIVSLSSLPLWNKIAAALYVVHYFNRAVVNPLFVAPSISPVRADVFLFAAFFNWLNSACLGAWLVGYRANVEGFNTVPVPSSSSELGPVQRILPYVGLAIFTIGMVGNILSERTLWRLRREEAHRRAAAAAEKDKKETTTTTTTTKKNPYSKVYVIPPPKGLFRWILYPHYALEWLEWFGFVLIGTAATTTTTTTTTPPIKLAPWLIPFAKLAEKLHLPLPLPALVFVLNIISTMLPQARRGRKWYAEKFGKEAVAGRSATIPGISFL
ncbi:hypothetical protein VTN96DRAFT_2497 [Rasamsonia emersonii]